MEEVLSRLLDLVEVSRSSRSCCKRSLVSSASSEEEELDRDRFFADDAVVVM